MKELKLITVYDSVAEYYRNPITFRTDKEALKSIEAICNDKETEFNKHPHDFTFFHIGTFNPDTGVITPALSLTRIGSANDFKKD